MKLEELIQEETMQGALKRMFKPADTIKNVMGDDAGAVSSMLQAKPTDKAFVIKKGSPMADRLIKSLAGSKANDEAQSETHGEIRQVRMMGGARVVVVGDDFLITSDMHHKDLVEAKQHGIYSKKKDEQEQIDPKIVKSIQKKAPKTANGKKPLET